MAAPVARDDELELTIDSLAYGGNGVARLNGFVVFVRRGLPGDTVRAPGDEGEARLGRGDGDRGGRRRARSGSMRPASTSRPAAAAASRTSPTRRRPRQRTRRCATRSSGSERIADPPLEPIVPAESRFHYRNKLEYSFTDTPQGAALGFHRAGRWDEVLEIERCWLTTDLGNADPRDGARVGAGGGSARFDQGAHPATSAPRRPRRAEHRSGARSARHRTRRPPGCGPARRRAAAASGGALDPLGGERLARRGDEPADEPALGRGGDRGGAARASLPRPSECVPADEHVRWPSACTSSRSSTRG